MRKFDESEDIFEMIWSASVLGNLGLFVGSGFTKALLDDSTDYRAYSWYELLKKSCEEMGVNSEIFQRKGSYSEIASSICKQYAINRSLSIAEGVDELKKTISELTNVYPTDSATKLFQTFFERVDISWIVTTNYDTLLESIFVGKSLSLDPKASFIKIKNLIPIYHIHGVRNSPESIVITNEDYVSLFRPNDYRQARLPFLIKESLVLMIGYGLGDINVITALDWSKNVYTNISESYDTEIIQLLYTDTPKNCPYRDESGVIIYEISSLRSFFEALNDYYPTYSFEYEQKLQQINNYTDLFAACDARTIEQFIDDRNNRVEIIQYITQLSPEFGYIYPSFINYLKQAILELNKRAAPSGAFYAYNQKLQLLIDILKYLNMSKVPPTFFSLLAESMNDVAYYIGEERGESWSAAWTWKTEKDSIPAEIKQELIDYATAKDGCYNLRRLLSSPVEINA